jgi:hypothetical protein
MSPAKNINGFPSQKTNPGAGRRRKAPALYLFGHTIDK